MTGPREVLEAVDWPGQRASLDDVADFVRRVADAAGLDARTASRLRLAVDEVCTNIVVHGYQDGRTPGRIRVRAEMDTDALVLVIDDDAMPFDATAWDAGTVVAAGTERQVGGLGLYLVEQSVDDALFERLDHGNRCTLRVRRRRATRPGGVEVVDPDIHVVAPVGEHARWRSVLADLGRLRLSTRAVPFTDEAPVLVTRHPLTTPVGAWRLDVVDHLDESAVEAALATGASDVIDVHTPAALIRRRVADALDRVRSRPGRRTSAERLAWDLRRVILPLDTDLATASSLGDALERITIEAMRVARADGGTVYLRDGDHLAFAVMRTDSVGVALGGTTGQPVPFEPLPLTLPGGAPNHRNAATSALLGQRTIHVDDIYHSRAFDFPGARAFDFRTGYRTVSCLTVPISTASGETLGVLQLLNARHAATGQIGSFDPWARELVPWLAARAAVAIETWRLREREARHQRASNELGIARDIQARFLRASVPRTIGWDVAARLEPARDVSGDFWDVFDLDSGAHSVIVVADICDKGVGAALYMGLVRSLLRAFSTPAWSRRLAHPGESGDAPTVTAQWAAITDADDPHADARAALLTATALTNDYLANVHDDLDMFATAFVGLLSSTTGMLSCVLAGHPHAAIRRADGTVEALGHTGPALGIRAGARWRLEMRALEPGDAVVAWTDGWPETRNPDGAFFGRDAVDAAIAAANVDAGAEAVADAFVEAADRFRGPTERYDDRTLLVAKRLGALSLDGHVGPPGARR